VVYAEGMHVNIPITMGRRGTGGRFPVKLLYVSNIPVILAIALFANVQLLAIMMKNVPVLGAIMEKISSIVVAPFGLREKFFEQLAYINPGLLLGEVGQSITNLQFIGLGGEILHAFLYIVVLVAVCVVFGKFWVEMAGQGPDAVANQLQRSGIYIPGFRRDPRIVKRVLERYIPTITILGSIFVGMLAGLADITGALGSGTGILLTVGIVYRLYEELARQQLFEIHPVLGRLIGK
jgi:preprotein translocase subunit SecY